MELKMVKPNGGEVTKHDGWEATVKIGGDVTDGSLTVLETRHDPGTGASAHIHSRESETFIVQEGDFIFRVGDARVALGAGGVVFGPPGLVHGFEPGQDGGRLLHIFVPAGMETFFTRPRDGLPGSGDQLRHEYGIESIED